MSGSWSINKHHNQQGDIFFMEERNLLIWLPRILIIDNETQFDNQKMREQCESLQIDHRFFSVSYP